MHLQAAHGEFAASRGDGVVARTELDQIAARRQTRQGALQFSALLAFGPGFADQLLESGACVW